jgi:O-antigen ligase
MLAFRGSRLRCIGLVVAAGIIGLLVAGSGSPVLSTRFADRFEERSPIEFRQALYALSWDLIKEKPWLGWGQNQFAPEIEARISGFQPQSYAAHNTFLEVAVEHGILGISIYAWMIAGLFRLSRKPESVRFASTWRIVLGVYLVNACFVVMSYQFVNALLFSFAGLLAARSSPVRHGDNCGMREAGCTPLAKSPA